MICLKIENKVKTAYLLFTIFEISTNQLVSCTIRCIGNRMKLSRQ